MKDNRQIIGISLVIGMIAGTFLGIVFGDEGGKGIGIGSGLGASFGIVIGAMIVKFNEDGSEQSDKEDDELMTDEEEKQVWEEYQGKVEKDKDGTS